jgi:hypothetical protein
MRPVVIPLNRPERPEHGRFSHHFPTLVGLVVFFLLCLIPK